MFEPGVSVISSVRKERQELALNDGWCEHHASCHIRAATTLSNSPSPESPEEVGLHGLQYTAKKYHYVYTSHHAVVTNCHASCHPLLDVTIPQNSSIRKFKTEFI